MAYVQFVDDETRVYLDAIQLSKKGTSYIYRGEVYQRLGIIFDGLAVSEEGKKIKVFALSRDYVPRVVNDSVVVITNEALPRFVRWLKGEVVWD